MSPELDIQEFECNYNLPLTTTKLNKAQIIMKELNDPPCESFSKFASEKDLRNLIIIREIKKSIIISPLCFIAVKCKDIFCASLK